MKILVIDNHDSFTYNLVQVLQESGCVPIVKSCKEINIEEASVFKKILISPGPGLPSPELKEIIRKVSEISSLFGVCLGQQAIAEAFGARLKPSAKIFHGESIETLKKIKDYELFSGIPEKFMAGRYHSWVIDPLTLSREFEITAEDNNSEIMGIRHKYLNIHAVQFHPESILTPAGQIIISNWLKI